MKRSRRGRLPSSQAQPPSPAPPSEAAPSPRCRPPEPSLPERIRAHYDRLTPLYRLVWGEHIHHGYWDTGDAGGGTPEEAQERLIGLLAGKSELARFGRVLDVGCGIGGSSRWLAEKLGCQVLGLTISHVQAVLASRAGTSPARRTKSATGNAAFIQADAARLPVGEASFDAVWIVECAEHLDDKRGLMHSLAAALRPGGVLAMCGWFRGEMLPPDHTENELAPLLDGMLLPSLATISNTLEWIEEGGLSISHKLDITERVSGTWDLCLEIARRPLARLLLPRLDDDARRFVGSFEMMKSAYQSGAMRYALITARRPAG